MARIEANLNRMGEVAVKSEEWLEQISKHLCFIEGRLMASEFLPFEVVRQFGQKIEEFRPHGGEWGWLLRSVQDISVRAVWQMVRQTVGGEPYPSDEHPQLAVVQFPPEGLSSKGEGSPHTGPGTPLFQGPDALCLPH